MILHLDYETRSRCDLKSCGSHRYAIDPSTEIFMASVSRDDEERVLLWINPKFAIPDMLGDNEEVEAMLAQAGQVYVHNVQFEQAITWGATERRMACPFKRNPAIETWRCTAAMARKAGLPWSLDQLGEALGLATKKDREGKALIKFFCEPQKDGNFNEPRDHVEKWLKFCAYCVTDTKVEKLAHRKMKAFELQGESLATFQFDLRMNQRGIPINVTAARNAQKIIDTVQTEVTAKFQKLTGLNPTQREKVREMVGLPDMQAATVETAIGQQMQALSPCFLDPNDPEIQALWSWARRKKDILEMYQKLSYAAVKKIETMLDCVCPDGRVRGGHRWYGTGPGRSSGQLLQPQNFKKTPPELRPITKQVYDQICRGASDEHLYEIYGEPLELISACIRHFIHDPNREILDGDYSAIQARVICWGAGQVDALQEYRQGIDRYKLMAADIYDCPVTAVTSDQREVGKRAILGLGFQMGEEKFQASCRIQYGLELSLELCLKAKTKFRKKHDKIVSFWYQLDRNARDALANPGQKCGLFVYRQIAGKKYLLMQLPSGRSIAYPDPQIEVEVVGGHVPTTFEDADLAKAGQGAQTRTQVTYWGQLPMSTQWGRIKLYGGKFAENWTMGVEADVMGWGCIEAEKAGMPPFMLVHDQVLAFPEQNQTPEQLAAALIRLPAWAEGLPVVADCKRTKFYTK